MTVEERNEIKCWVSLSECRIVTLYWERKGEGKFSCIPDDC